MRSPTGAMARRFFCAALVAAIASCGSDGAGARRASPPAAGRETVAPASDRDGILRVLVFYDMEGVSGQDSWRTFIHGSPDYPRGRELLTADLNAVIDGLFAGGVDSVEVVDAHGSTNALEPDVLVAKLDPRAVVVYRDQPFNPMLALADSGRYDAVVGVAQHAKTGSRGFASHTITIGMEVALNGATVTESELMALSMGRVGVPLVFVSGDHRLQADLSGLPWLQYVVTKRALSADSVDLRPVDEVHREMKASAKLAIERLGDAKAIQLTTPVTATLRAVEPASLRLLEGVPGIRYQDNSVTFEAPDFGAALEGLGRLVNVANRAYGSVMERAWQGTTPPDEFMRKGIYAVIARWMDVESGRWTPEPEPKPEARKYHGAF